MKQAATLILLLLIVAAWVGISQSTFSLSPWPRGQDSNLSRPLPPLESLLYRQASLTRKLAQLAPTDPYIVVDTARNVLYLKRREHVLLTAVASTGSGTILDKPDQPQGQWVFDTPRGFFTVQSKLLNPVWVKPDWAFVEAGLAVPHNPAERLEPGVLGEYALGFGQGYFIHGTLYARLLGKNVTHGCIRLNDEDLRAIYKTARVGTPVMIF
jgi:L,D-transpeptidase YbiS